MSKPLHHGPPDENEKRKALAYMALSPTEKYESLIRLIKLNYQIRMSNKDLKKK